MGLSNKFLPPEAVFLPEPSVSSSSVGGQTKRFLSMTETKANINGSFKQVGSTHVIR